MLPALNATGEFVHDSFLPNDNAACTVLWIVGTDPGAKIPPLRDHYCESSRAEFSHIDLVFSLAARALSQAGTLKTFIVLLSLGN
jgi:hypothetical protein